MHALTNRMVIWAHRYQLRKAEKWQERHDRLATWFPAWRTQGRRKFPITIYHASLIVMLFCAIAQRWWPNILSLWLICTFIASWALTTLRISIMLKDSAPDDFLDEYEYSVLSTWKSISFRLLSASIVVAIGLLAIISRFDVTASDQWVFTVVLLMIVAFVSVSTLPAMAHALTFPYEPEDA